MAIEDFTTYAENNPDAILTGDVNIVTQDDLNRNEDAYIYQIDIAYDNDIEVRRIKWQ